ncbi:MAG: leucyl aminopeptidase [Phycisphaerales bacterium]|nr:leucyl aminopeptidase [Phycisphaerales bacterium]
MTLNVVIGAATSAAGETCFLPSWSGRLGARIARSFAIPGDIAVPANVGDRLRVARSVGRSTRTAVVVSMGPVETCTAEILRRVGGAIAAEIRAIKCQQAVIDMAEIVGAKVDNGVRAFCEGLVLGSFRFDRHKTTAEKELPCRIVLAFADGGRQWRTDVSRGIATADGVNEARRIAHEPANVINPITLAAETRRLARRDGLKCRVLDHEAMKRLNMGGLLAVGNSSQTPPRLIVLAHGDVRRQRPVILIGKAVTFDTGGYSIKDKQGIVGQKYDKCGGTAVMGVLSAAAALRFKVPVVGIIAAAENMIAASAYRPNDIIRTMAGKTVEIISTDAEGRMVLADALTYAQKHYKPRAMINLATLTGGIVVALGRTRAGLFANNTELSDRLYASGQRTFERLWPMPLDDDYFELLRSDDADMRNSAGRDAHPILGGVFLKQFVDPQTPWAHLDIAGVSAVDKPGPYCPAGGTGFGVRLLCDYLESL